MAANSHGMQIKVPAGSYKGLGILVEHADRVVEILNLGRILCEDSGREETFRRVSERVDLPVEKIRAIYDELLGLYAFQQRQRITSKELVDGVTAGLSAQAATEWKSQYFQRWEQISDTLVRAIDDLVDDHPIAIEQKALQLTFSHENLLERVRVITDVRPVFNQKGDKVVRAIISHLLMVDFKDGEKKRRIHFALDAKDLEGLLLQCNRAVKKAEVARTAFAGDGWQATIAGE